MYYDGRYDKSSFLMEVIFNYNILGIWQGSDLWYSDTVVLLRDSEKFTQISLQISLEICQVSNFETAPLLKEKLRQRFTFVLRVCSSGEFKIKTLLHVFIHFFGILLLFFIIKIGFYDFRSFLWWSIKFPQQNINQSKTGIDGPKLSVELYFDDPSGVLIPSTTRYSQLYRVEPSYTE